MSFAVSPVMGSYALKWEKEPVPIGTHTSYQATLPWQIDNIFAKDAYQVYDWKGQWAYSRPVVASVAGDMGLSGQCRTIESAFEACARDARVLYRLHRWQVYMRNNDPPEET